MESPKLRLAPSSIQAAAGSLIATLILCSPLVVIVVARERIMFSSFNVSIRRLSYSSGTRYPPSASTPSCNTLSTRLKLLLRAVSIACLYSSRARPCFSRFTPVFIGFATITSDVGFESSLSIFSICSKRSISIL